MKIVFVSKASKRMANGELAKKLTDADRIPIPRPTTEYFEMSPQEEKMFKQNHRRLYDFIIKYGRVLGYTIE